MIQQFHAFQLHCPVNDYENSIEGLYRVGALGNVEVSWI